MNYGQLKNATLKILDEFSSRGAIQSKTKTADMQFKIQDLANDTLYDLATISKLPAKLEVSAETEETLIELPADWLEFNCVMYKDKPVPPQFYIITSDRNFKLKVYPTEVTVYYWRKPKLLVFTGDDSADDQQTLDISEDAARTAPYNIAGQILISEGETAKGTLLLNIYESKKTNLVGNDESYDAHVIDIMGWS